jgi:hypothetical protein
MKTVLWIVFALLAILGVLGMATGQPTPNGRIYGLALLAAGLIGMVVMWIISFAGGERHTGAGEPM